LGVLQVEKLTERFKDIGFDKIISSDLKRAKQTSEGISNSCNVDIIFEKRLREYDPGEVDPQSEKWIEKYKEILGSGVSKYEIRPFGGENIWDLIKRVQSFLRDLEKEDGTIAIISHSGVNAALINLSQKRSKDEFLQIKQDNVCINTLEYEGNKWNVKIINDSSHISDIIPMVKKYMNQKEIKEIAKEYVLEKLGDFAEEIFLTGDIINESFGTYDRPYMRYKGSVVDFMLFLKKILKFLKNGRFHSLLKRLKDMRLVK